MGSLTKAKARMKELADFAAQTPFSMEDAVVASRQLHVFSDGALGATGSLRLVGDAAAAMGADMKEVSFWVGRAYSMIKGGQPFGEAAMRLQELGIITPQVRSKMEELQASGAANIEVWNVLASRLSEFKGGMSQMSTTGDGLISTLEDTATAVKKTFGEEFKEVAKGAISGLIEWLNKLIEDGSIKKWASNTLDLLYKVAGAAKAIYSGGTQRAEAWAGIKELLVGGLEVGAQKAVSLLEASAPRIGALIGSAAKGVLNGFQQEDYNKAAKDLGIQDKMGLWSLHGAFGSKPYGFSDEQHAAVKQRMGEIRQQRDLEEAGFSDGGEPAGIAQKQSDWDEAVKDLGLSERGDAPKLSEADEQSIKQRMREIRQKRFLSEGSYAQGESSETTGEDLLARAKLRLQKLGEDFQAEVDTKMAALKDAANAAPDPQAEKKKAEEEEKIRRDMAAAQALVDEKRQKETAQKEAEERARLARKQIEDEHKARVDNIRAEAQASAQSESAVRDRLSRAKSAAEQAWGWYRDPEAFKRQLAEEKAGATAEKQYAKDLDRLDNRSDWRTTKRLTDSEESVRRVAIAREEQDRAQKALLAIEKNTAGLEGMLKKLLTAK